MAWKSDREIRKEHEAKWQKAGVDPRRTGDAKVDRKLGDLDRAIQGEVSGAITGGAKGSTWGPDTIGSGGTTTGTGTLGIPLGHKVDRPFIPGGCLHKALAPVLTLSDGKRLYAGMGSQIREAGHLDLILDCAGLVSGRKFVKGSNNPRYRKLNAAAFPDVVTLAWPDMTAPTHVGIRFWIQLRQMLPQDTAVCCMGGHGRTGTALASILVADGVSGDDAIRKVRKDHCPRAIETVEQENYIRALGRQFQAEHGKRGNGKG